jgi:7,8-dihydroneopterin aldolase/epimerase/oxygenase
MSGVGGSSSGDDEVTLRGMRFHVRVGILPHERELPQPLEVDVSAHVAPGSIVDYRELYDAARAVVDAEPLDYLERIGDAIASRVLGVGGVRRVRVAVRKPHVALAGPLLHAEVVVVRDARA